MSQSFMHKLSAKDALDDSSPLRTLIDGLPEQIYVKNTEGRYVLNNLAHVRALGAASPEEVAGKSDSDFYPEELAERYRADEREVIRSGQPLIDKEEPSVDGEGNERWHSTTKVPLRDSSEQNVGVVGITRDVTERKEAEEKLRESEARLAEAQRIAHLGNWEGDAKTGEVSWSDEVFRIYGYEQEFVPNLDKLVELSHPDDRELLRKHIDAALHEGKPYDFEHRVVRRDGQERVAHCQAEVVFDEGDEPRRIIGTVHDITERKRAEEKLRESEERFRSAFENAPIGVALVGLDRRHLRVNRAFCEMLGYSEEELLEKAHPEIIHPEDHEVSAERLRQALEGGPERYVLERRYLHADGRVIWNLTSVSLIRDSEGEPDHLVCLHQDITDRKELEEQLRHQAFHDSLTELPNRLLFLDRLNHALARTTRESGPVAVLLVDLDDFKVVNDSLGHDAGNTVLAEVAERLRGSVRPGDTVGRIFGDEFVVLLEAPAGVNEARQVAERIQESLQAPFDIEGHEVYVRASIGITLAETAEDEPKEVLRHADLAMYEAKKRGIAQYEVYNPSMVVHPLERMNLERDLRRAVEREEFEVHYQPKVLLETGEIGGVEALVRWKHPDRGLLAAGEFIQLAEETGLINQIGLWVLEESCRQLKEWQERYPEKLGLQVDLCVNLSAKEIRQPDLANKVAGVLSQTGLTPSCLTVEISEKIAMEDAEHTIAKLRELKELGVELALDDFGAGYCSLVYLEHSLLDFLKIDRLLIHRKKENWEECVAIVSAMTSMAHTLGLAVIVEGVEDKDQVAELKKIGCEMGQGHYFAEPLSSEAAERLLVEGSSW